MKKLLALCLALLLLAGCAGSSSGGNSGSSGAQPGSESSSTSVQPGSSAGSASAGGSGETSSQGEKNTDSGSSSSSNPQITQVSDKEMEVAGCMGTYTGPVNADGLPHGTGSMIFTSGGHKGNTYEGVFSNGEMTGPCTYWFENGDSYIGEFANDDLNGAGTYKFANGTFFQGKFYDSTDATGVYTDEDGNRWNATIHDAVLSMGEALPKEPEILSDPVADEVISSFENSTDEPSDDSPADHSQGDAGSSSGSSSQGQEPFVPSGNVEGDKGTAASTGGSSESQTSSLTPETLTYILASAVDDCEGAVLDGEATFIIANESYETILDNASVLTNAGHLKDEWLTIRENMVSAYNSIRDAFTAFGYEDYPIVLYIFSDHVTNPRLLLAVKDGEVICDVIAMIAGWKY